MVQKKVAFHILEVVLKYNYDKDGTIEVKEMYL